MDGVVGIGVRVRVCHAGGFARSIVSHDFNGISGCNIHDCRSMEATAVACWTVNPSESGSEAGLCQAFDTVRSKPCTGLMGLQRCGLHVVRLRVNITALSHARVASKSTGHHRQGFICHSKAQEGQQHRPGDMYKATPPTSQSPRVVTQSCRCRLNRISLKKRAGKPGCASTGVAL